MTARPWRAAAYWAWSYRVYTAHAAARTRTGLDRFVAEREAAGQTVDVWEVLPLPEVEAHVTQAAASPAE